MEGKYISSECKFLGVNAK